MVDKANKLPNLNDEDNEQDDLIKEKASISKNDGQYNYVNQE